MQNASFDIWNSKVQDFLKFDLSPMKFASGLFWIYLSYISVYINTRQGPVAKWIASLIAGPGVVSSIPACPHTFMEIYPEIFSNSFSLFLWFEKGFFSYKQNYVYLVLV